MSAARFIVVVSVTDIQPGEMKYNRKVSEDLGVDLSVVPEISPSLGLVAGRDRRDANNRSLTKRRPASLRQSLLLDSKEEEIMGTERVDLSQIRENRSDGKVSLSCILAICNALFLSRFWKQEDVWRLPGSCLRRAVSSRTQESTALTSASSAPVQHRQLSA